MLANSLFYLEISDMSYSYEARLFESKKGLKCLIKRNVSPEDLFDYTRFSMNPPVGRKEATDMSQLKYRASLHKSPENANETMPLVRWPSCFYPAERQRRERSYLLVPTSLSA